MQSHDSDLGRCEPGSAVASMTATVLFKERNFTSVYKAPSLCEIFYSFETSSPNATTVSYSSFEFLKRISIQKAACCSKHYSPIGRATQVKTSSVSCRFKMSPVKLKSKKTHVFLVQQDNCFCQALKKISFSAY